MFKLHSLACRFPVFPAPLTEETVFSPLYIVAFFMTDYLTIVSGLFLGFISCSVCPFLCQYHIVLITVGLYYSLKSGSMLLYTFYIIWKWSNCYHLTSYTSEVSSYPDFAGQNAIAADLVVSILQLGSAVKNLPAMQETKVMWVRSLG